MEIEAPYLLFLGDAKERLSLKVANGVVDWRPELAVGEIGLPECTVTLGLEPMGLEQARKCGAKTFVLGMNNSGGRIPPEWVPTIRQALISGFDIASGMHERLTDIAEIAAEAHRTGGRLIDVRHSIGNLKTGTGTRRSGKRLLTVGTDCSVGKMYTSLALEKEMGSRGLDVDFVATGQSGIFICGDGIAIDCVISDFVSGAVEQLTPDNEPGHWDVIEGQGSLFHPSFAGVSLGLLHGAQPDALVLCHAENRSYMRGMRSHRLPNLRDTIDMNLQAGRLTNADARFIGIAVNTSGLSDSDSRAVLQNYEDEFQLPCVDAVRTGVASVVDQISELWPSG